MVFHGCLAWPVFTTYFTYLSWKGNTDQMEQHENERPFSGIAFINRWLLDAAKVVGPGKFWKYLEDLTGALTLLVVYS